MHIRPEQIAELNNAMARRFEDEMVAHLAEFSPPLFKVIKENQMRVVARFGINKAGQYGFTLRGPIRLYLELMLLFGSHFDIDPQYPWANEILTNQDSAREMERAEQLYEKTADYQEKVSGLDAANTQKALADLMALARKPLTLSTSDFETEILHEMKRFFPEKVIYVGEENLIPLIRRGSTEAQKYDFPTIRGEVLLIVLMYVLGYGCTADPLYPWVARTLMDARIVNPAARAERLEKKALTYLEHVLISYHQEAQT